MEFKINSSLDLISADNTKRMFNRNLHSDVLFYVEDNIIYAHSHVLMKRSVVFEQRLGKLTGAQKMIPIINYKYESVHEFIRYIYTDECAITVDNGIEILKLANQYKIIMLENKVLNCVNLNYSKDWLLKLFEYCVIEKYELVQNAINFEVIRSLDRCFGTQQFLSLHPDAVYAILQFESIPNDVTEENFFTALGHWIKSFCELNHIPLSAGRQTHDKLIRKIRFSTMTDSSLHKCCEQFPGLLNNYDLTSISKKTKFGGGSDSENVWVSKYRTEFIWPYEYGTFSRDNQYETRLSVSQDTILHGIRIGANAMLCEKEIQIEICTSGCETLNYKLTGFMYWDIIINLGTTVCLKSNREYKIVIKYINMPNTNMQLLRRKAGFEAIINDPDKTIKILQITRNVFELFFKSATE